LLEENKALVRSFFKKANQDNGTATEMCANDFSAHIVGQPPLNLEAFERYQEKYYTSFSDTETIIEDLIAEGDQVAFRGFVKSVHTAEFMGIPATGKQVVVPIFGVAKITDGKIAEWWNSPDRLSWMQQIGALPELGKERKNLNRERNIQTVQSFFKLIDQRKIKEISELYAENGKNIAPYHSGLFPGLFIGRKEIYKFWKVATEQFSEISFPIDEIMPFKDSNKVAVKLVGKLKFKDNRGIYENDYLFIFNFDDDGKILEFYEYYNPITSARAFGLMDKIK